LPLSSLAIACMAFFVGLSIFVFFVMGLSGLVAATSDSDRPPR
jgi:hypothetical protein